MTKILNIGSEAFQRHTLIFQETEIILKLRFLPVVEQWFFDAEYKDFQVFGIKLALGVLHMRSRNQPFDFVLQDNSGSGLDSFKVDDFVEGRCSLFLLDPEDMKDIRGTAVQI
jgi:hypothetical protein